MISLITVGYQHPEWIEQYLSGLAQHEPLPEVVCVDVSPTRPPSLPRGSHYIQLGQASYATAVNRGLRAARGNTLLWGNDDLEVDGPFLEAITTPIRENPKTLVGLIMRQQHSRDYVEGCLVAMPRQTLVDVGYLDETLPGCFEDVDYSWRAVQAGYRLVQVAVPVTHVDYGRLDHRVGESHALFRRKWRL